MGLPVTYDDYAANPVIPHSIASDLYDQVFGILGFGAAGYGQSDTAVFSRALGYLAARGQNGENVALHLPHGHRFLVDLDVLPAVSNLTILGGGQLISTSSPSDDCAFFTGSGVQHFSIDGIKVRAADDKAVLVRVDSSSDIRIDRVRSLESRLLETGTRMGSYAAADTSVGGNVCRNITVQGCTALRSAPTVTTQAAVLLLYAIGAQVVGNTIRGYPYGVQWWGGDANPGADGAVANERKCGELTITGNTVADIKASGGGGAGIWGSMAYGVTITGNTVLRCDDVGIDFEGCFDCTATGNTVHDCTNGNLTTFFYSRNVLFSGNSCQTSFAAQFMVRVQNASGTTDNEEVTFRGNTFRAVGHVLPVTIETVETAVFEGNTLRNCIIYTIYNNQKHTVIAGNVLVFDVVASSIIYAIGAGHTNNFGKCQVERNTIRTLVAQPAGSRGIYVDQFDYNTNPVNEVNDNKLSGWPDPIEVRWAGGNFGFVAHTFIRRNNCGDPGSLITITEVGAATSNVTKEGNYRDDSTAVT